jgi:WD40 repeat protein
VKAVSISTLQEVGKQIRVQFKRDVKFHTKADNGKLIVCFEDGTVQVWNVLTGQQHGTTVSNTGRLDDVTWRNLLLQDMMEQ